MKKNIIILAISFLVIAVGASERRLTKSKIYKYGFYGILLNL